MTILSEFKSLTILVMRSIEIWQIDIVETFQLDFLIGFYNVIILHLRRKQLTSFDDTMSAYWTEKHSIIIQIYVDIYVHIYVHIYIYIYLPPSVPTYAFTYIYIHTHT